VVKNQRMKVSFDISVCDGEVILSYNENGEIRNFTTDSIEKAFALCRLAMWGFCQRMGGKLPPVQEASTND